MLIDMVYLKDILFIACTILNDNFFFDKDTLKRFIDTYRDRMYEEYCLFEESVDDDFRAELKSDLLIKECFTSYFASVQLYDCLIEDFHFEDFELDLFDNILPKFTGANWNESKSSEQRKNNREFFERL